MADIPDRLKLALRKIVLAVLEERLYGLYPYVVEEFDTVRQLVSGRPLRGGGSLPRVSRIPIRTPLEQVVLRTGSQIVVGFEGGDPAFPFVATYDYAPAYSDALPVARQGDMCQGGGLGQVLTLTPVVPAPSPYLSPLVPYLVSFGTVTNPPIPGIQGPIYSVITTGSLKKKTL